MKIRLNDSETILVETDADAEFDRRSLIGAPRSEPNDLEIASKSPLRGGRIRWRLRPIEGAVVGSIGKIYIAITRLDGTQIVDNIDYEILPESQKETKQNKGFVPPFDVLPISPEDDNWGMVWPDLEETQEKGKSVAYKATTKSDGTIIVYYSTVFPPFSEQIEKLKIQSETLQNLFETNYKIWIGYHAILQQKGDQHVPSGMDEDLYEQLLETERVRVSQIEVKQALRTAELIHRLSREQNTVLAE